jgi:regulator of replication initiation timing
MTEAVRPRGETPLEKRERVTRSFTLKVEMLEKWGAQGLPPGQWWPQGPAELARWQDDALEISAWKSPNITSPGGRYSKLRSRFDKAIERLLATSAKVPAVLNEELAQLKANLRTLSEQNCKLLAELQHVRDDLAKEMQLKQNALALVGELRQALEGFEKVTLLRER